MEGKTILRICPITRKGTKYKSITEASEIHGTYKAKLSYWLDTDLEYLGYLWYRLGSDKASKINFTYIDDDLYRKSRRAEATRQKRAKKETEIKDRLTKREIARKYMGVKLVLLDYETGEYIDEYDSISALAEDYDIVPSVVSSRIRDGAFITTIKKYKLAFMKKECYDNLIRLNQK